MIGYDMNYYLGLLRSRMSMNTDFARYLKAGGKLLVVEGATDTAFVKKIKASNVSCISVSQAFGSEEQRCKEREYSKALIIKVVYGMDQFPQAITVPGMESWDVYGLIDLDFDSKEIINKSDKLFVTDTHDLETMLLSTDEKVIGRLDKCKVSEEQMRKALFMAYQLSFAKRYLYKKLDCGCLAKKDVDYSQFFEGYILSFKRIIHYINLSSENGLSPKKINALICSATTDKLLRKKVNKELRWDESIEDFTIQKINDFWEVVNGHDILNAIRYISESAYYAYSDSKGGQLNREFEMDLISKYEYANFEKTELYRKMSSKGMIVTL